MKKTLGFFLLCLFPFTISFDVAPPDPKIRAVEAFKQIVQCYNHHISLLQNNLHFAALVLPIGIYTLPMAEEMFDALNGYKRSRKIVMQCKHLKDNGISDSLTDLPFNVLVENDDGDDLVSIHLAQELTQDPRIIAVVGHNTGRNTLIAAKIYAKNAFPVISPTADGTLLTIGKNSVMQMLPRTDDTVHHFLHLITEVLQNQKPLNHSTIKATHLRLLILRSRDLQPLSAVLSFLDKLQMEIRKQNEQQTTCKASEKVCTGIPFIEYKQCDLNDQGTDCAKNIDNSDYDGVILLPEARSIESALQIAKQASQNGKPVFSHPTILTQKILNGWWKEGKIPGQDTFKPDFRIWTISPYYITDPFTPWRTAMTYDALMAIKNAYNTQAQKPESLQDKLLSKNFSFYSLTGHVFFYEKRTHEEIYRNPVPQDQKAWDYDTIYNDQGKFNPFVTIDFHCNVNPQITRYQADALAFQKSPCQP